MYTLDSVTVAALRAGGAQAQVDRWLGAAVDGRRAILIESAFVPVQAPSDVSLMRFASGCVCCVGQVVFRVRLMQLARQTRPRHLLLLLASTEHLDRVGVQLRDGLYGFRVAQVDLEHQ